MSESKKTSRKSNIMLSDVIEIDDDETENANVQVRPQQKSSQIVAKYSGPNTSTQKSMNVIDTNVSEANRRACYQTCVVNLDKIFKVSDHIIWMSQNPADMHLGTELKNCWGRVIQPNIEHELYDKMLQDVLLKWAQGVQSSRMTRGPPLCYQCRICDKAWWTLHPFKEHIRTHKLETLHVYHLDRYNESYIIAGNSVNMSLRYIPIKGNCPQCGEDSDFHQDHYRTCNQCWMKLPNCTLYMYHRENCGVNGTKVIAKMPYYCRLCSVDLKSKTRRFIHMRSVHDVRSDVPMPRVLRKCTYCNKSYHVYQIHPCSRSVHNQSCKYCYRKFFSSLLLDLHLREGKQYQCTICKKVLDMECMETEHMLSHTDQYVMVYKCNLNCSPSILFPDYESVNAHRLLHHQNSVMRQGFCEKVIVPKICLEYKNLNTLSQSDFSRKHSSSQKKKAKQTSPPPPENDNILFDDMLIKLEIQTMKDLESSGTQENNDYEQLLSSMIYPNTSEAQGGPPYAEVVVKTEPIDEYEEIDVDGNKTSLQIDETTIKIEPMDIETQALEESKILESQTQDLDNMKALELETEALEIKIEALDVKTEPVFELNNEVYSIDSDSDVGDQNTVKTVNNDENVDNTDKNVPNINTNVSNANKSVFPANKDVKISVFTYKNNQFIKENIVLEFPKDKATTSKIIKPTVVQKIPIKVPEGKKGKSLITKIKPIKENSIKKSNTNVLGTENVEVFFGTNAKNNTSDSEGDLYIDENISHEITIDVEKLDDENDNEIDVENDDENDEKTDKNYEMIDENDEQNNENDEQNNENDENNDENDENNDENNDETHENEDKSDGFKWLDKYRRKGKLYTCSLCGFKSTHMIYSLHKDSLCRIKTYEPAKAKYTCTKCNKTFMNMDSYVIHFKDHGFPEFGCPFCLRACENQVKFVKHIQSHVRRNYYAFHKFNNAKGAKQKKFPCKYCCKLIAPARVFAHWESHITLDHDTETAYNPPKPRKCMKKKALHIPQSVGGGSGQAPLRNDIRPKKLTDEELNKLLSTLDARFNREQRLCFLCVRPFERQTDLKRHFVQHLMQDAHAKRLETDRLALGCQKCGALFDHAEPYKCHMREHAGMRVIKCHLCERTFSDSSNYCKHTKTHGVIKVFICDVCQKKFHKKDTLEKHVVMHLNTKPLKCPYCNKLYHVPSMYKKHMRSHERKLMYRCNFCGDTFKCVRDKWDHQWQAHGKRKYTADCPICDKRFRKHSDVTRHVRSYHGNYEMAAALKSEVTVTIKEEPVEYDIQIEDA